LYSALRENTANALSRRPFIQNNRKLEEEKQKIMKNTTIFM